MKGTLKNLVLLLAIALVFSGCKQPTKMMDEAKAAVNDVTKAGADLYAVEELKKLNDDLTVALDEVNTQDQKFFKKFGKSKEILAAVKADAEAMKAALPAKIEAAKNNAITLQSEAQAAIAEAKALLEQAPKGKGTKKDIEALTADLSGVEAAFAEIQTAIDSQDYIGAAGKANTIKEKAVAISDQVKAAIEKIKKK
ncbi:MAG: hypothetical protein WCC06_13360 [Candidatus Aminicenantales bacterium]